MKKILLSTILPAIGLMALNANAATPTSLTEFGPVTISWTVSQQEKSFSDGPTLSTNHTPRATNYVSKYKATTSTVAFTDASLLELLTNSFKTNFAKGSVKLVTDGENVYLVDKTGSNLVLEVSSVISLKFETDLSSGESITTVHVPKSTNAVTTTNSVTTESQINFVRVKYDDSALITDGTASTFHFDGVSLGAVDSTSTNGGLTSRVTQNFSLHGVGHGTILGKESVISGTVTGSSHGTVDVPF